MPRINIEDSLYRNPNFLKLCLKVGCNYKALGMLVTAFSLAQEHYLSTDNDRLIPFNKYPTDLKILVELGFVEQKKGGLYVKGSESQFAWLLQRSNAGKAKKSQRKQLTKRPITTVQRSETESNGSKPLSLSLTHSLTHSHTQDQVNGHSKTIQSPKGDVNPQMQNRVIWETYRTEYLSLYGVEPVRNAKVNAHVNQLRQRLGLEAPEVVKFYFKHPGGYYIKNTHDISLCVKDAESLRTQWLRNKPMTQSDVKRFEDNYEFVAQQKRLEEMLGEKT